MKMFSILPKISRQSATAAFRCNERCISSVVQQPNLPDSGIVNEPILSYAKNSPERNALIDALKATANDCEDIPIVIGGQEIRTKDVRYQVMPHNHSHKVAKFYWADSKIIENAIKVARDAQTKWDRTPLSERLAIWNKAADLMAGKHRQQLNSATMLGQSKTVFQAEIDSAAELVDFIRMNAYFLKECTKYQPISENPKVTKNSMRYRGIDGFVAAVSPFNFTAIGGNLAYTPALMGCAVLWKPSDTAVLSNWRIFKIMREAGVPDGVVNFVPADGPVFGDTITQSPYLAGINFTGSVPTFNRLWKQVGNNIDKYKNFPRMVGECGGKNFHFIHPSADFEAAMASTVRGAFEFCGQKCSACSRLYVPASLWPKMKEALVHTVSSLKIGDVQDFSSFAAAVIDEKAFQRITSYIEHAKRNPKTEILVGGTYSDKKGYFVNPTIIETKDPHDKLMKEEIFGPVLTVFVYEDAAIEDTMEMVKTTTPFALTGAVFAEDERFLSHALEKFKMAAGNFYINDKSTGAIVGQQPFGGGRLSGTNDKAGGPHYVLRWTSPQAIKETFVPQRDVVYPYMKE